KGLGPLDNRVVQGLNENGLGGDTRGEGQGASGRRVVGGGLGRQRHLVLGSEIDADLIGAGSTETRNESLQVRETKPIHEGAGAVCAVVDKISWAQGE